MLLNLCPPAATPSPIPTQTDNKKRKIAFLVGGIVLRGGLRVQPLATCLRCAIHIYERCVFIARIPVVDALCVCLYIGPGRSIVVWNELRCAGLGSCVAACRQRALSSIECSCLWCIPTFGRIVGRCPPPVRRPTQGFCGRFVSSLKFRAHIRAHSRKACLARLILPQVGSAARHGADWRQEAVTIQ